MALTGSVPAIIEAEISRLRMVATSFSSWDLPDVGALVDQAPHMDRQPAAVHIVRFFAQQIEKLGVHEETKLKVLSVSDIMKTAPFPVSQGIQLQFVIGRDLPQLLNIKGRKPRTAANQDLFAVLPETSCQGLFNQIHKKATKKVPGSTFMLLTLRRAGLLAAT